MQTSKKQQSGFLYQKLINQMHNKETIGRIICHLIIRQSECLLMILVNIRIVVFYIRDINILYAICLTVLLSEYLDCFFVNL